MIENTNFRFTPVLREMVENYCLRIYEADAIIDDEHLFSEYVYLRDNNKLNVLFEEEYLINWLNDDDDGKNRG